MDLFNLAIAATPGRGSGVIYALLALFTTLLYLLGSIAGPTVALRPLCIYIPAGINYKCVSLDTRVGQCTFSLEGINVCP